MTVIGLFGIIGTVEYAHAITFSNYFEDIKVNTANPYPLSNYDKPPEKLSNVCFMHYYFYGFDERERHFVSLNPYLEHEWTAGYTPITNITIEQDDKLGFYAENINNTDSIKMTYPDGTERIFKTHTTHAYNKTWFDSDYDMIREETYFEKKRNSFFDENLRFLPIGTTTIEFIGPTNCFSNTITINVIESKEIIKLKEKTNDKIDRKNLWKERYNTCFENKENFKTELSELQSNFDETQQELSTYEGMYNTLETQLNQYKLDIVDKENEYTQLLNDHETQLESYRQQITNHTTTITEKQDEIDQLKQQLLEAENRIRELEN